MRPGRVMELHDGHWRPSCPLPLYQRFGRCRCECGERFKNESLYEGHWRSSHGRYTMDDRATRTFTPRLMISEVQSITLRRTADGIRLGIEGIDEPGDPWEMCSGAWITLSARQVGLLSAALLSERDRL